MILFADSREIEYTKKRGAFILFTLLCLIIRFFKDIDQDNDHPIYYIKYILAGVIILY